MLTVVCGGIIDSRNSVPCLYQLESNKTRRMNANCRMVVASSILVTRFHSCTSKIWEDESRHLTGSNCRHVVISAALVHQNDASTDGVDIVQQQHLAGPD